MDIQPLPPMMHPRTATGRWPAWFRMLFPLAMAVVFYGHTIFLPVSLIDDGLFYERAQAMLAAIAAGEGAIFWSHFWTPEMNRFGPGLFAQLLVYHGLCGMDPALLHTLKLLVFAVFLGGVVELVRLSGRGMGAAVAAAFVVTLLGRPSLFPDFQTHLANWQRLHTTDSHFIWLVVWAAVAIQHFARACGWRRVAWAVLAAACIAVATLTKISVIAHVGGAIVAIMLIAWRERVGSRWSIALIVLAAALAVVSIPGLLYFEPWATQEIESYEGQLTFSLRGIRGVVGYAAMTFLESWGPLLFVVLPVAIVQFVRGLLGRTSAREFQFLAVVLGMGGAAFCLMALWSITLPRYMITYTPFVAVLAGVFLEDLWRAVANVLRARFGAPHRTLAIATILGAIVVAAACVPIVLWQRPTLLRFAPMLGVLLVGLAGAIGWWICRHDARRVAPSALVVTGLFLGVIALQGTCLLAYWHQSVRHYTIAERATTHLVDVGMQLHAAQVARGDGTRAVLHTNHFEEPWVQAAAFFRATGVDDLVTLEPLQAAPEMEAQDIFLVYSTEAHWGARVVPPVVAGWHSEPLAEPEEMAGIVVLTRGESWRREVAIEPGTVVTGIEFRADVSSWPARSQMEIVFSDDSGERARLWHRGELLPRMNTNVTFLRLDAPFAASGESVTVEARLHPPALAPTRLATYVLDRSRVVAPAVRDESGDLRMMMTLYGTTDAAPRYRLDADRVWETSSYVVLPPGSLLEAMLFGRVGWRSPHPQAFRPVAFQYRVETWRAESSD
jgi:hypothetical protein